MGTVPYRKKPALYIALLAVLCVGGCKSVNSTDTMFGMYAYVVPVEKNFIIVGPITVCKTEIHSAGPLGLVKSVAGSKVAYTDLVLEAANMQADDIIDVRIDVDTVAETSFAEWLTGWSRTYTYTGTALAIAYITKTQSEIPEEEIPIEESQTAEDDDALDFSAGFYR